MKRLQPTDVRAQSVAALGLDPNAHALTSSTSIAAALRRSASFLCPCVGPTLVRNVLGPLRGLVDDTTSIKTKIEDVLEQVVAHGDLFEYRDSSQAVISSLTVLYAAPCGFVPRPSGAVILLGVSANQLTPLPDDLEARVEYRGHVRLLKPLPGENLRDDLLQLGLIEVSSERWLKAPSTETAAQHLSRLEQLLQGGHASGEMSGLVLLDPATPVRFYRDRWTEPKRHSGCFVARRDQAYGAPVWCFVQMTEGRPERFIDFPRAGSRWRGCDEAWQLQMAIDALRHKPQRLRVQPGNAGTRRLEGFSPVPMWAQRRWDAVGPRIEPKGCLFALEIPDEEVDEEIRFAREVLWLETDTHRNGEGA